VTSSQSAKNLCGDFGISVWKVVLAQVEGRSHHVTAIGISEFQTPFFPTIINLSLSRRSVNRHQCPECSAKNCAGDELQWCIAPPARSYFVDVAFTLTAAGARNVAVAIASSGPVSTTFVEIAANGVTPPPSSGGGGGGCAMNTESSVDATFATLLILSLAHLACRYVKKDV
jgi:hypothetical protein